MSNMNKENLLKAVLNNEALREKYWKDEDLSTLSTKTLLKSSNKYIRSLTYLFDQLPKKSKLESLFKMFKL